MFGDKDSVFGAAEPLVGGTDTMFVVEESLFAVAVYHVRGRRNLVSDEGNLVRDEGKFVCDQETLFCAADNSLSLRGISLISEFLGFAISDRAARYTDLVLVAERRW